MKLIFTIILILSLASCQLLKKDKLTLKRLNQMEELQVSEQRNTLSQQSQLVIIDSNHQDYTMTLWPKGQFKFTVANGFEGEAEKVLIKGKHSSQKKLNLTQETKQDSTLLKANYTNEKESLITIKKNKLSVGYNGGLVLLFIIFYVLYWIYRRYKVG